MYGGGTMSTSDGGIRTRFDELKPGDRIEVEHTVILEGKQRPEKLCGTVVRTEHRGERPPCGVGPGDSPSGDVILLELCDGELTAVALDRSTVLRRA